MLRVEGRSSSPMGLGKATVFAYPVRSALDQSAKCFAYPRHFSDYLAVNEAFSFIRGLSI